MTNPAPAPAKITATQVAAMLEDGEPIQALDDALEQVCSKMKAGGNNATLIVEIENDLESDEIEDEDEDEESDETETKSAT